jgi:hypothetical protein
MFKVLEGTFLVSLIVGCGGGATVSVHGTPYDFAFVNLASTIPSACCPPNGGCTTMGATPLDNNGNGAVFDMVDNVEYEGIGLYSACSGFTFVDRCASSANLTLCAGARNRVFIPKHRLDAFGLQCSANRESRSKIQAVAAGPMKTAAVEIRR